MELLTGEVSPHRVHALLRLVRRLRNPQREDLLDLLQPSALLSNQRASMAIYRVAKRYDLIVEQADKRVAIQPDIDSADKIESVAAFRAIMQKRLLAVTEEHENSYQLNLLAAWYAVQNERLFHYKKKDEISVQFNADMYPRSDTESRTRGRGFNPDDLNGWLRWASFLGWGLVVTVGKGKGKEKLLPDAHIRLQAVLPELLSATDGRIPFAIFAHRLAERCPELDGGVLFEKCWQASRSAENRGNRLSLMLSTGLRVLHEAGQTCPESSKDQVRSIELTRQGDATDIWRLYPAQAHPLNEITHIQIKVPSHD